MSPNNPMQRTGTHQVLGRWRPTVSHEQFPHARVRVAFRALADGGRWATMTRQLPFPRCLLSMIVVISTFASNTAFCADNVQAPGDTMLTASRLIAFLSSSHLERTTRFYRDVLGFRMLEANAMVVVFETGGTQLRVSKIDNPVIAPYTVLGWSVADIRQKVGELSAKGVQFERFPGLPQNAMGIATFLNGDQVAWFKDPEGHILSLTEFAEQ